MEDQKIDFIKIKAIREEINNLLKLKPELIPFQEMIENELKKAGKSHVNRMSVLMGLMMDKRAELASRLDDLSNELGNLTNILKDLKDENCKH